VRHPGSGRAQTGTDQHRSEERAEEGCRGFGTKAGVAGTYRISKYDSGAVRLTGRETRRVCLLTTGFSRVDDGAGEEALIIAAEEFVTSGTSTRFWFPPASHFAGPLPRDRTSPRSAPLSAAW